MNSTPQLDLHPDAESLNAFTEQALGAPEREQILAHLAGCSRCRQVIFLAQQAAADAEAPARVAIARPAQQPVSWFWNWRLAWIPAAAMAAALALVVTFHPRHTSQVTELAKAVPLRDEALPTLVPREQPGAGATHMPAPTLATNPAAGSAMFGARRGSSEKLAQRPAPSAAFPAEPTATAPPSAETVEVQPTSMFSAQQETSAQSQPEPAVTAWQQEQQRSSGAYSASANTSQVSQKSMRMEAYSAHASRPASAGSAGPRVAQQSQSTPSASFDIGTQQQLTGLTASRKAKPSMLPSGLAAISRATARNLTLEIDLAGALFLSDDSGVHWQQVAQQWTGRAIEVRAKTSLSGSITPVGGFELQNDAGSTWASADGKTWTAQ